MPSLLLRFELGRVESRVLDLQLARDSASTFPTRLVKPCHRKDTRGKKKSRPLSEKKEYVKILKGGTSRPSSNQLGTISTLGKRKYGQERRPNVSVSTCLISWSFLSMNGLYSSIK